MSHMLMLLTTKVQKQFELSNIIRYICTIKLHLRMKLNRIKAVACNRIQPNLETLQQIAEILQVDLKDLITDKDERE